MKNKKIFLSILSGLLLGLSWPTYGFSILIFISFVPLLIIEKLLRNNSFGLVFFHSYVAFFLWNSIATWWLGYASLFGMAFAIIVNSFLMASIFSIYSLVAKKVNTKLSIIYFICSWIVFEKFHLIWDFSWPWLNLGNVFSENTQWIQWYEYTGSFGGTLWILIVNFLFLHFINNYFKFKKLNSSSFSIAVIAIAIPVIVSIYLYNKDYNHIDEIDVSILQPNIDPYKEKYNQTNFSVLEDLKNWISDEIGGNTLIIAPETYFSESPGFVINDFYESRFTKSLSSFLKQNNSQLLSGIQFYSTYQSEKTKTITSNKIRDKLWIDVYNSSFFLSGFAKPQIYHKSKLVVGVENMPYKSFLEPIIGNALIDLGGTVMSRATQKNRDVFVTENQIKIAPLICYESVYGEYVTKYVRNGAQFLAIITNDGWWNESQGYKQHLSYAKLRAIETRRNVVRSANTGSSAIINQKGEITKKLNYDVRGYINHKVGLNNNITFYVKYGDIIFRFSLFFSTIILLFAVSKKK